MLNASNKIAAYTVFADSSSPVKHVGQIIGLLCGQDGFDSTKRAVDKISIVYKTSKTYVEEKEEEEDVEAYVMLCSSVVFNHSTLPCFNYVTRI